MRRFTTLPVLAAIVLLSTTAGWASAQAAARAVINDEVGDVRLINGLPSDKRAQSIDIYRFKFEKVDNKLVVTTTIKSGKSENSMDQYMVATATVPSTGLKFLIQAATNTSQAYVAEQSWSNEVFCPKAKSDARGSRLVAIIPLKCLDRPARLASLTSYTVVEAYDGNQYVDLAEDFASGKGILKLR